MSNYQMALSKTFTVFKRTLPTLIGIILLMSLINVLIPKNYYTKVFFGNYIIDPILGAIFGSISAGNVINSYVIGGELLKEGVSMLAVVAFLTAWVTVGVIQIPAEALMLGRRFSIIKNTVNFVAAIIIAAFTVVLLNIL